MKKLKSWSREKRNFFKTFNYISIRLLFIFSMMVLASLWTYNFVVPNYEKSILISKGYDYDDVMYTLLDVDRINEIYLDIPSIIFTESLGSNGLVYGDGGEFKPFPRSIIMYHPSPSSFVHEVGHNVFNFHLDTTKKNEWIKISENSDLYVTDYAKKNYREDFAESFMVFILNRDDIEKCDNKTHYSPYGTWQLVFPGIEEWDYYVSNQRCNDTLAELNFDEKKVEFLKKNILKVDMESNLTIGEEDV